MDSKKLLQVIGAGRMAFGVAMLAQPERSVSGWVGSLAADPRSHPLTRALGARDLVLGALTVRNPDPALVRTIALCDTTDGIATILARKSLSKPALIGVAALALGSAAAQLALAQNA